ncbi:putative lipase YDL109C [Salvia hispanica]|uniref:putative lipase YDL109C n=1 Tax=Salvia hispanica TaxID=49212 RepID=UPI002009295B|nr:putative lipase YDL109C [Salvia hispanica]
MENRGAEDAGEPKIQKFEMDSEGKDELSSNRNNKTKPKKKRHSWIPRFPCTRLDDDDDDVVVGEKPDAGGLEVSNAKDQSAAHLIVMVNGIIGSAQDWRYAAKHFVKAYPSEVVVHCSEANSSMLTLDGVDVMGKRLADEVVSVVGRHPNLEKISFVGHSLGGLIARYAIAVLYQQDLTRKESEENGEHGEEELLSKSPLEEKTRGKIAGLQPINFITSATPHLGARGHRQIPVLCGFTSLEKAAMHTSGVLRRTGKHLFLRDNDNGKPPLLLQMADDSDDLKFISALESFKRRVAYANTSFDHIVGWSSSSIRRYSELPKRRNLVKIAKYRYIFAEDTSKSGDNREAKVSRKRISEMEEVMIQGLTRLSWERIDVDFSTSIQGPLAHTTILVKTYCINSHGTNVIQHMIDNFQL